MFRSVAKDGMGKTICYIITVLVGTSHYKVHRKLLQIYEKVKVVLLNPENVDKTHTKCGPCSRQKAETKANIEDQCKRPCTKGES